MTTLHPRPVFWLYTFAAALAIGAAAGQAQSGDLKAAAGFHQLFLHDDCTGDYAPQPDTCLHKQLLEKAFTFGGKAGVVYNVKLRIRGIFEPTTIQGGETPLADHPYYGQSARVVRVAHRGQRAEADVLAESLPESRPHHLQGRL